MSTTICTAVVLATEDPTRRAETMAVAGFLAGCTGATRTSYATDLRVFAAWCHEADLSMFTVRRSHLELLGRWMEENGRMRSTVARRLSSLSSFYKYCEQEDLVERNPALNVRRPKVDYESRTLGLDRNELGAFLVQAGIGSPRDHALASLQALNGLRISEALGADVDDLDFERGHRTLKILRKGGKRVLIPLAPRTSRVLDLYLGERTTGPIFLGAKGGRMRPLRRRSQREAPSPGLAPPLRRASVIQCSAGAENGIFGATNPPAMDASWTQVQASPRKDAAPPSRAPNFGEVTAVPAAKREVETPSAATRRFPPAATDAGPPAPPAIWDDGS